MAVHITPLVSPLTLLVDAGDVFSSYINCITLEYVNVLGFVAGHKLDDLWNNFSPGD